MNKQIKECIAMIYAFAAIIVDYVKSEVEAGILISIIATIISFFIYYGIARFCIYGIEKITNVFKNK
ncbi:hypothetical protein [Bacillus xiapuensis]|uniref:Uncharacterized protein n=1 Tax=Bacillus xiapuensis TaxID=2014075 RepID=A0ABU6N843_9BACI|nr:hypothetical protein [Bacillus xiapuensis]